MNPDEIVQLNREYTFFTWSVQGQVRPVPVERGEGVYFWDAEGKRYLDFSSQLMNLHAGYGNPRIVRAIKEQVERLAFAWPGFATEPRGRLGKLLA
ncbi:MAG: aminotransferase class III-fold pyridoxal phosphate-dependent enzyme, partial [Anaerolineae bacterium]